jgi:hypothetical protein
MSFRRPARCARTATAPTRPRRSHPRPASTAAALSAVTSGTKIEWCCTSGLRCAQTILRQTILRQTMNGVPKRVPAAGLTASFSVRRRRGTCICAVLTATRSGRSLIAAKFRERHSIHSRDARAIAAIRSVWSKSQKWFAAGLLAATLGSAAVALPIDWCKVEGVCGSWIEFLCAECPPIPAG